MSNMITLILFSSTVLFLSVLFVLFIFIFAAIDIKRHADRIEKIRTKEE